jgi:hypothetical protein
VVQCQANQEVHIIQDNLSAHKTKAVGDLSGSASASEAALHSHLLFLVESGRDLAPRSSDVIARGMFTSVPDLARKLRRYTNAYSANAKPIPGNADVRHRIRSYDLAATDGMRRLGHLDSGKL